MWLGAMHSDDILVSFDLRGALDFCTCRTWVQRIGITYDYAFQYIHRARVFFPLAMEIYYALWNIGICT